MSEVRIKELLLELLVDEGNEVEDSKEYGLLTMDEGLVLLMDGKEFEITIKEM